MLTSKQFMATFVVLALVTLTAIVGLSAKWDTYAVFHRTDGPKAVVFTNERLSKHLFCYRYIPENFDSILIGPSVSGNLRTASLPGATVYNASLDGSNLCELKVLTELILARKRLKYVFIVLHPVLLRSHEPKTQFLKPGQYWVSYGSLDLIKATWTRYRVGAGANQFDAWGRSDFNRFAPRKVPAETVIGQALQTENRIGLSSFWRCDPIALGALKDLIQSCQGSGARVVILFPPMPRRLLQKNLAQRQHFMAQLGPILQGQQVVDFNLTELVEESCFVDQEHLSDAAADRLVQILGDRLKIRP